MLFFQPTLLLLSLLIALIPNYLNKSRLSECSMSLLLSQHFKSSQRLIVVGNNKRFYPRLQREKSTSRHSSPIPGKIYALHNLRRFPLNMVECRYSREHILKAFFRCNLIKGNQKCALFLVCMLELMFRFPAGREKTKRLSILLAVEHCMACL